MSEDERRAVSNSTSDGPIEYDGHPDLATLAELAEGCLPFDTAQSLNAHVAQCLACQAASERIAAVQSDLAALEPITLPDDVAERLQHALDAEARQRRPTTTVLAARRAGWRSRLPAGASVAAAAAVLALIGGVSYLALGGSSGGGSSASGTSAGMKAAPAAPSPAIHHTGQHYTQQSLQQAAAGLLPTAPQPAGGAASSPANPAGGAAATAVTHGTTSADHGVPAPLSPLNTSTAIYECAAHTGFANQPLLAADYAYYDGKPSLIMVFPDAQNVHRVTVIVAPPTCATDGDPLFTTVIANR